MQNDPNRDRRGLVTGAEIRRDEMTHTPGPWGIDGPTHGPERAKWVLAPSPSGKYLLIAEVLPTGKDASAPNGNDRDDNAKLIASAPTLQAQNRDLLAALERLTSSNADYAFSDEGDYMCVYCNRFLAGQDQHYPDCPILQARVLIAKGETK